MNFLKRFFSRGNLLPTNAEIAARFAEEYQRGVASVSGFGVPTGPYTLVLSGDLQVELLDRTKTPSKVVLTTTIRDVFERLGYKL